MRVNELIAKLVSTHSHQEIAALLADEYQHKAELPEFDGTNVKSYYVKVAEQFRTIAQ